MKIRFNSNSLSIFIFLYETKTSTSVYDRSGWITPNGTEYSFEIIKDGYITIAIAKSDLTSSITMNDYDCYFYLTKYDSLIEQENNFKYKQLNILKDCEQGGWTYSEKTESSSRVRSKQIYKLKAGNVIKFSSNSNQLYICTMEEIPATSWTLNIYYSGSKNCLIIEKDCYCVIIFAASNGTSMITPSDVNSVVTIYNSFKEISGKQVNIYRFGGKGNDWCFVRTPTDYDPYRQKPYPFVICNHGNGWVMDGSEQYANWTKRTMYVPLTDPDYIANPTQFNGTSDSSLWYSNPTIEKLLSEGYIVCGCENYGDGLYGNNDCRNACADFYYHMIKNYNVEKRVNMIGASNGALTSLNTMYLLGRKIKSMVLQYPLCCLVNQYENHESHQAGIRNAYGIEDSDITEQELIVATKTHDIMYGDIADNKKMGYVAPIKFYYSTTDTITEANVNTLPLYNILIDSLKIAEKVQVDSDNVTREHGDYAHFDPTGFYNWFENN